MVKEKENRFSKLASAFNHLRFIFATLGRKRNITQSDVALELGLPRSRVSRLFAVLERFGILSKKTLRGRNYYYLTDEIILAVRRHQEIRDVSKFALKTED